MSTWKRIAVRAERSLALIVALLNLAILYPDLLTLRQDGSGSWIQGGALFLAVYAAILLGCVAAVVVGQKRWWILRLAAWVLLLARFWSLPFSS